MGRAVGEGGHHEERVIRDSERFHFIVQLAGCARCIAV